MLQSKIIGLSLVIFLNFINYTRGVTQAIEPDCVTPDDALGSCVDVRYCVSIMTALINGDHLTNDNVAKFLRESQCGIEADSQKVCCHIDKIDFGETPTSSPKTSELDRQHERCGKLEQHAEPSVWIAEVWYKHNNLGRTVSELKCLGTVISTKHVIVPAHCVTSLPQHLSLDHLSIDNDDYLVGNIFVHPGFNNPKYANDIAIVELDVELSRSQNPKARAPQQIQGAICLNTSPVPIEHDKSTVTLMKNEQSPLRIGSISIIPNSQCSSLFDQQFTDLTSNQFCANIQSNDTDISPFIGAVIMTYDYARQEYSLRGFTATVVRAEQAFDESRPFIFTDVEKYHNWIRSAVAAFGEIEPSRELLPPVDIISLDKLRECQSGEGRGRCIIEDYCTTSPQHLTSLRAVKCTTGSKNLNDDGICCPEKFVNQSALVEPDFDPRIRIKKGLDLLDIEQCGAMGSIKRIVGGKVASLKEFPWYALIKHQVGEFYKFMCGGSLISSRYVLTAAHCIHNTEPFKAVAVRLGEHNLITNPDCAEVENDEEEQECNPPYLEIEIEDLIPHPQSNRPRFSNDIGLVRMVRNVEFKTGTIIPICLPYNSQMQQTTLKRSTVAGFGLTENGTDSNVLLRIFVPKVTHEKCAPLYAPIKIPNDILCFGGEGIVDSCKGDSGSPLLNFVLVNRKAKAVQMGIVASGHKDCGRNVTGIPGLYTDVAKYMTWILDNMYEDA